MFQCLRARPLGSERLLLEFQLLHFLAVCLWASPFTSLNLNFLICKMGIDVRANQITDEGPSKRHGPGVLMGCSWLRTGERYCPFRTVVSAGGVSTQGTFINVRRQF